MPYAVRKSGSKYKVVNRNTGKVYGTHDSKEKANKQLAALHIHTHESKIVVRLKQELILESNGCISIIPEGTTVFVDRYSALGMEPPNPETICKGECEGTGYVPTYNPEFKFPEDGKERCCPSDTTPLSPALLALWNASQQENPTDDGWHFVKCPDCNGRGEVEIANNLHNTVPSCPVCNNKLMKTRGVGYTHACSLPVEQGKNHTITVVGNKAVQWDGTRDHYSRLSKLAESKVVLETIMDKTFDEFNKKFQFTTKDGYYEVDSIIDDFVCYLVENFGWYINRHSKNQGDMLPSFKEYVWLVNKAYPQSKLVITDIGNNKIKVEGKKLYNKV